MSGAWIAFHFHRQVICINGDLRARTVSTLLAQTGVCEGGLWDILSACSGIHKALTCALVECPCLTWAEVTPKLVELRPLLSLRVQVPTPALGWSMPWRNLGTYHHFHKNKVFLGWLPARQLLQADPIQLPGGCRPLECATSYVQDWTV